MKDLFTLSDFIPSAIPCDVPNDFEHLPKANLPPGVKLPKTENDWNIANGYFKLHLHYNSENTDINLTITTFNQTVYNYFHHCFGLVNPIDNDLEMKKYINFSKNKLKKVLKSLKVDKTTSITEIKYVSRLLRSKLRKEEQSDAFNHNDRIKENYWKNCKNSFETNATCLPTFSENDCWKHFMKTCHESKPSQVFNIPS